MPNDPVPAPGSRRESASCAWRREASRQAALKAARGEMCETAKSQVADACGATKALHVAGTVRFAEIDGLVVILDLSTADYFVLNATGTHVWKQLLSLEGDVEATTRAVAARYPSVDRSDVSQDVRRTVEDWRTRGFLSDRAGPAAPTPGRGRRCVGCRHGLALCACWTLVATAFSFRRKGFAWTYLDYANLALPPSPGDVGELTGAAESAFLRAENLFQFASAPRDCLPRSLALFRFCRAVGLPVGHRIGGRRFPQFVMHAWVECGDRVVLDDPACRLEFKVVASIPP